MKGRVIGSADSDLIACLPFTQMQDSFFAERKEVRREKMMIKANESASVPICRV